MTRQICKDDLRMAIDEKVGGRTFSICGALGVEPMVPMTLEDLAHEELLALSGANTSTISARSSSVESRLLERARMRLTAITAACLRKIVYAIELREMVGRFAVVDVAPVKTVDPPFLIEMTGSERLRDALQRYNDYRLGVYSISASQQRNWLLKCVSGVGECIQPLMEVNVTPQEAEFVTDWLLFLCAGGYTADGNETAIRRETMEAWQRKK